MSIRDTGARSVAAIGVLAMVVSASAVGMANGDVKTRGGYCRQPVLRDYERELRGFAEIAGVPASGSLPFGPSELRLSKIGLPPNRGRILTGDGTFGYVLGGPVGGIPLEWNVASTLSRLNSSGAVERVVDGASGYVERVAATASGEFTLRMPMEPGPYRYDMSFGDRTGRLLGTYGQYIEVVRPKLSVRLAVKGRYFRAGSALSARLENLGTEGVESIDRYWLLHRVGSSWHYVSGRQSGGPGFVQTQLVGAGAAGKCIRAKLAQDLKPGRYRLVTTFRRIRLGDSSHAPTLTRSADFSIRARTM